MSDVQVQVGGDFSELMRGFQQLEARAQQSGQAVGKGLNEGIQGYSSKSLAALNTELSRLQQRQLKVAVDSSAFEKAGQRIREIETLISQVERRRLTINADPSSLLALRTQLGTLQSQLERVKIGSDRFRELSAAIQSTERELARAGESTDKFRILDGVVQGIAFSLSNAVVDGARQAIAAIGGVVAEYGQLDTELRKAAAASGEAGAYESLARSVDQVGIEAAGTTLEVARLNTELIRGGMTVDQANASLAAIVRGAEATGTSFDGMGSVVSASLKSFGLEAQDAQRVVDALVTGANASAASAQGLGMAFKYAAPVAKLLGVSIEDLALAAGLLTNAGIDASEAGVTLRNGLSKLASAAPKAGGAMDGLHGQAALAAKAMRSLGVDIYQTDGTLKPMEETLLKLKAAFEKLDPSSKIRLAANLFGGEDDGAKWLALLNQSEEEIKRMATTMANTKGSTDVARDAMTGFELKVKQLDGTVGSIRNTLGGVAATALLPFVDAANAVVGSITGMPSPVKNLTAGLVLLTGAYITATAASVAFTKALQTEAVQSAISGVRQLAGALKTGFVTGIARLGVVALAVGVVAKAMEGASEASGRYSRANEQISKSLFDLQGEIDRTSLKIEDNRNVFQRLWESFGEGSRVMGDINTTNAIANSVGNLTTASKNYLSTLDKVDSVTGKQRTNAIAYVAALQTSSSATQDLAKDFEELAKKADLSGDTRQAEVYREAIALLNKQATAAKNTADALISKAGITEREIVATGKASDAIKQRVKAEDALAKAKIAAQEQRKKGILAQEQQLLDAKLKRNQLQLDVSGIDEQISVAKQLATLEGTALLVLQQRLAINEKIRQQQALQLAVQRELARPPEERGTPEWQSKYDDLLGEQEKINAEIRKAYADAGAALATNAKQAAQSLKSAQDNLRSVLRGGFNYLTKGLQQQEINRARATIQPLVNQGIIRQGVDVSTPENLFQLAAFAESYTNASNELSKAQIENTNALLELTKKNWQVNVSIDSNGNATASGDALPVARWAGGTVAAGQTVRINDGPSGRPLGQESFLTAAGKLSLINRPANSLWTPSTDGMVIPAGVTEQLKARGLFDGNRAGRSAAGGAPAAIGGSARDLAATVAHQAIAIGKLQQSVDRLVQKDWSVNVGLSTGGDPTSLHMINRMV